MHVGTAPGDLSKIVDFRWRRSTEPLATTGLFAALAIEAVWDRSVYMQTLRQAVITDPPY